MVSYYRVCRPISAMFSSNKISQHNKLQHTTRTQHCSCTAEFLHKVKTDRIYHAQYSNYIAATHSLSVHIKMHYTPTTHTYHYPPTTTHPIAFHNPSLHTTNKHKAYLCKWQQNGTRCRDGVKVLWCHSYLVWLVFEASIPTCTCFPSENFL